MSPLHASVVVCLVWCRVVEPECVSALFTTLMDAQFSVDHGSEAQTSIKVRLPPPLLTGPHLHAATNACPPLPSPAFPCRPCPSSLVVTPVSVVWQVRDRQGRVRPCLCRARVHWMRTCAVVVVGFFPKDLANKVSKGGRGAGGRNG